MKKYSILLAAALLLVLPSCKNKKAEEQAEAQAEAVADMDAQQMLSAELQANLGTLVADAQKFRPTLPMFKKGAGKLTLTDKEKMVKPTYLIDPSDVSKYISLTQKYRAVSMLSFDSYIAELYNMPTDGYDAACAQLETEINDPSFSSMQPLYHDDPDNYQSSFNEYVDNAYSTGRAALYWEASAASLVECLFVCTRDIDKFTAGLTDQAAQDLTFDIICVQDNLTRIVEYYPEMSSLNEIIKPIYVLDAITVDQLREQLLELKGEISVVRAALLN